MNFELNIIFAVLFFNIIVFPPPPHQKTPVNLESDINQWDMFCKTADIKYLTFKRLPSDIKYFE